MSAAPILHRLHKVKQTGTGRWIASCPGHEDKSPSLSVRELDDGRVLLHDFGGCHVTDVLAALGLEMGDLFPDRPEHHRSPTGSRIPASDRLSVLADEALTVGIIAGRLFEDRMIGEDEWSRLSLAIQRIQRAKSDAS
jgi:hypothetical protein